MSKKRLGPRIYQSRDRTRAHARTRTRVRRPNGLFSDFSRESKRYFETHTCILLVDRAGRFFSR